MHVGKREGKSKRKNGGGKAGNLKSLSLVEVWDSRFTS